MREESLRWDGHVLRRTLDHPVREIELKLMGNDWKEPQKRIKKHAQVGPLRNQGKRRKRRLKEVAIAQEDSRLRDCVESTLGKNKT
ncbi:hypothetical protein V3C99_000067 [Haemonchus contortus]|uniref:40S ribosomal protein S6 n=1 Tax=Haemonchus contortus TaxID=6289 RepID=A0A7I4YFG9_HAECO